VEEEANWVRQIFAWYIERVALLEIRSRLIEANVQQKGGTVPPRIVWSRNVIQHILRAAKEYAYGIKTQSRGGETISIPVEPIIALETFEAFLRVKEANTNYPARHLKQNYLIGGLLYCACGRKWGARSETSRRRNRAGEWVDRPVHSRYYYRQVHEDHVSPACPRQIGTIKADNDVWEKVCKAINEPEILLDSVRIIVDEIRANAESMESEQERVYKELERLSLERQWVITKARRGGISEAGMDLQLGALTLQELSLRRDLESITQAINIQLLDDWEERVSQYLTNLQAGIASLDWDHQSVEDEQEIYELKRQTVATLVRRVTIDINRELHVEIGLKLREVLHYALSQGFEGIDQGEIKPAGIRPGWLDNA
jgi:hypothetical protein